MQCTASVTAGRHGRYCIQPPVAPEGAEQADSLADRLRPFQREGVKFGLRAGGRLLIGDEMGLGKTVQACALAKCYQQEWPVLVVAPSSLRWGWQPEHQAVDLHRQLLAGGHAVLQELQRMC
jgi:SNF2 family DNA or RNA helicase